MEKKKDTREVYNNEPIEVNGNKVFFDGKLDTEKNELKVYRMRGDVNLFDEALQNFCIEKGINKATTLFTY